MRFYVVSTVRVGTQTFKAGQLVDDQIVDTAPLIAAGALLWPAGTTPVASAAAMIAAQRSGRGIDDATADRIMHDAVSSAQSRYRIVQATWNVDPANSTGKADDDGDASASTPLKTFAALYDRFRALDVVVGTDGAALRINVLSSAPDPKADPFSLSASFRNNRSVIVAGTRTRTGSTFPATAGLVAPTGTSWYQLAATWPGGSVPAHGTWVRVVGGANDGNVFQIDADLGGGVARVTRPSVVARATTGFFSAGTVSNGDTLEILTLPQLAIGEMDIHFEDSRGGNIFSYYSTNAITFDGVDLRGVVDALAFTKAVICQMVECTNGTSSSGIASAGIQYFVNCWNRTGLAFGLPSGSYVSFTAGMIDGADIPPRGTSRVLYEQNVLVKAQTTLLPGASVDVFGAGFFDITGDGFFVFAGAVLRVDGATSFGNISGYGLNVSAGGTVAYTVVPTIAGTTGDFRCGQTGTLPFFRPDTGAFVAAQAQTWANFNTVVGSGGFGGNVVNIANGAKIVQRS